MVEARAKGTLQTKTPVMIASGELTEVHLDGSWQPMANNGDLVYSPAGYAVGWRAVVTRSVGAK